MISGIWIAGVERRIVVGPSLGRVHLTAMVQAKPPAPILMMDINFSKLRGLAMNPEEFRITICSEPENPAVLLDFRNISGSFDITFTDKKAMVDILACLPIDLIQIQNSQSASQGATAVGTRDPMLADLLNPTHKSPDNQDSLKQPMPVSGTLPNEMPQMENDEDGDRDYNQLEEDIYGEDISTPESRKDLGQLPREGSSNLPKVSDHDKPTPAPVSSVKGSSRPASRRTNVVTKVYGRASRLRTATPAPSGGKQSSTISRASSTSSSTGPDTNATTAPAAVATKVTLKPVQTQPHERDYFDRPPPNPSTRPQSRTQRKSEPKPNLRKRSKEASDEEWAPTTKKSRTVRAVSTSKTVTFKDNKSNTVVKKNEQKKIQNVRRQSAPVKASQYGPAAEVEDIQEESSAQIIPKAYSVKRTSLPLSVSSGKTISAKNKGQEDGEPGAESRSKSKRAIFEALKVSKAVIEEPGSSDDSANDESFSDGFNHDSMDIDDFPENLRQPSPDLPRPTAVSPRKQFTTNIPPPLTKKPVNRTFSDSLLNPIGEAGETVSPGAQSNTPNTMMTRKRPRFIANSNLMNLPEGSSPVTREHRDGKYYIKARQTETDEEAEESEYYTPTPSSRKPVPKQVELVLRNSGSLPTGYREEFPASQAQHIPPKRGNEEGGERMRSHGGFEFEKTKAQVIKPSDRRLVQPVKRSQPEAKDIERPNGFHERLIKAGIKLSFTEASAEQVDDMLYTSDSSLSEDESETGMGSDMEDDPSIPTHQRNIRNALREISEVQAPHSWKSC